MFQFPRCPPVIAGDLLAQAGLPHSETSGSQAASASPEHFVAWPRPSSAVNAKASTMRPLSRIYRNRLPSRLHASDRLAPHGPERSCIEPAAAAIREVASMSALSPVIAALAIRRTVLFFLGFCFCFC
jgi:hypothetical protein